ncbi:MAG: class I SAM-dependent methyltransferase, partial [bacterium]|nr:class I SAM-dependent methyltransferase [bacterium]
MKSFFEMKSFWEDFEEKMFTPVRIEQAVEEVGFIINITGLKPGSNVLDFPCGVGRHSIVFSKLGYDVTGVDITEKYLKKAVLRSRKEKVKVEFKKGDIRKYKENNKYDLVINMYTSFGYFPKLSD